jgi:hypothetical protein
MLLCHSRAGGNPNTTNYHKYPKVKNKLPRAKSLLTALFSLLFEKEFVRE